MKRYSLFTILVFLFFIFSIDDQSCSAATVNGLSGKTKTKASAASAASMAASVPRKLDQPQDLTVPDIVTWLPVLLTASSTSTQGKLLKSVDNSSFAVGSVVAKKCNIKIYFIYDFTHGVADAWI